VEDEEVGDGEADQQRQQPGEERVLQRLVVKPPRRLGGQDVDIVLECERWVHAQVVVVPEADHHDHGERQADEEQKDEEKRRHLEVRRRLRAE
jgi:hypothetical protein